MAAVTNYNPAGPVLTDVDYPALIDKTLDQVIKLQNKVEMIGMKYLVKRSTKTLEYKENEVSSLLDMPQVNDDADNIPMVAPSKGFESSFTAVEYRSGIAVTRKMVETDYHGVVRPMIDGLPNSVRQRKEYLYASLWNDAFTGSTYTGGDGVAMCSASHPHRDPKWGTWSNLMTAAAPSQAQLTLMWRTGQAVTNDKGHPEPVNFKSIMTSPTQWPELKRLLVSSQEAENSLNAENIWKGVFTLDEPNHYLTSTTAYFGIGDMPEAYQGLICVEQSAPTYVSLSYSNNPDIIYGKRARFVETVGLVHGKNVVGCAGA